MKNTDRHKKIGEILLKNGKINIIQLGMALDIQKFQHLKLGQILTEMKVISKKDVEIALDIQRNGINNDIQRDINN